MLTLALSLSLGLFARDDLTLRPRDRGVATIELHLHVVAPIRAAEDPPEFRVLEAAPGAGGLEFDLPDFFVVSVEEVAQGPDDQGRPLPPQLVPTVENFERRVFGNMLSDEARRDWLMSILDDRITGASLGHELTGDQLRKLRLAGRGDIEHFLDEVRAGRRRFETDRWDEEKGSLGLRHAARLAARFEMGPFLSDSLFQKTLNHMIHAPARIRGEP